MRKNLLVAMIAAVGGFCLASAPAFGVLGYNVWVSNGDQFQLGYVIGYLDGVQLSRRKDVRANIPTGGGKDVSQWVSGVNAFYEKPENQRRQVPDAMYEIGARIQAEMLKGWRERRPKKPSPSPSSQP